MSDELLTLEIELTSKDRARTDLNESLKFGVVEKNILRLNPSNWRGESVISSSSFDTIEVTH